MKTKNIKCSNKIKCVTCGKEFSVPRWRVEKAKHCSFECYNEGRKTKESYDKPRVCVGCGEKFLPTQWYQKFCNRDCFCKSSKKTSVVACKNCGKDFTQVRLAQKYCSRKCSNPYKDKALKKPKNVTLDNLWSKKVKVRSDNKCEYCGKTTGLNSHHIFSRSNHHVRWDIDNGISLCVSHHIFGLVSAHKSPIEFIEWLKDKRGVQWYERLRIKAREVGKITKEEKEIFRVKLNEIKEQKS